MICPKCNLELNNIRKSISINSVSGQVHVFSVPAFSCPKCLGVFQDNFDIPLRKLMAIDLLSRDIKMGSVLKYVREAFNHSLDQAAKLLKIPVEALASIENSNSIDHKIWRKTSELVKIIPGEFDSIELQR